MTYVIAILMIPLLFGRRNKLAGSAHFTLRCKKLLSSGQSQYPLAALAFDFGSMLMTPSEMKVFFHEFGHALHTILSRAEFQHLAGLLRSPNSHSVCCLGANLTDNTYMLLVRSKKVSQDFEE